MARYLIRRLTVDVVYDVAEDEPLPEAVQRVGDMEQEDVLRQGLHSLRTKKGFRLGRSELDDTVLMGVS